jgi:arylsulfatase A-like enzyme
MEHGRSHHGNALHNEEVHVPLFVRDPGAGRARVVERVVSTVDLFPTVLGRLGFPLPSREVHGVSLFDDDALARRTGVLTEVRRVTDQRGFIGRDGRKAIFEVALVPHAQEDERRRLWESPRLVGLFDFERDYFEQRPLDDGAALVRMRSEIARRYSSPSMATSARVANVPAAELSEETLSQLKALGYLE